MNIFVLSYDVKKAAKYSVDKHIIKMPTEHGQLLSTVFWHESEVIERFVAGRKKIINVPKIKGKKPLYKLSHVNHPCAIWVRESRENFLWLVDYTEALYNEYQFRYGPNDKHGRVVRMIKFCKENHHLIEFPKKGLTPFALAMPWYLQIPHKPVLSYRLYYMMCKRHLADWKKRKVPFWYK